MKKYRQIKTLFFTIGFGFGNGSVYHHPAGTIWAREGNTAMYRKYIDGQIVPGNFGSIQFEAVENNSEYFELITQ